MYTLNTLLSITINFNFTLMYHSPGVQPALSLVSVTVMAQSCMGNKPQLHKVTFASHVMATKYAL